MENCTLPQQEVDHCVCVVVFFTEEINLFVWNARIVCCAVLRLLAHFVFKLLKY